MDNAPVVHSGKLALPAAPRTSALWAGVLCAGEGAVSSHATAAELLGLLDRPARRIHVTVPAGRRFAVPDGMVAHRSNRVGAARHPSRLPPRTRIEETVVDLTQDCGRLGEAIAWVVRACAARLTTPARLTEALAARPRLRWRRPLTEALRDTADGCHSPLELRYARAVERPHGLPRATRQARRGRWYDDVAYPEFGLLVELDGRPAHPAERRGRDFRRDNAAVAAGLRVLRYGWGDVVDQPCPVAGEVAALLRAGGWSSAARVCGPDCVRPTSF